MDLTKLSAFEMKRKLHKKEISSRELIEEHFKKIDETDKNINSFITLNKEEALKAAERVDEKIKNGESLGLLAGIPIGIKDNIMTKNLRTTCGSKMLENFIPPYNATVIDRISDADGIIMGKTNMDEFSLESPAGEPYFGATKNPFNQERVQSGSSGGAAAVLSGQTALGLGTDTGGCVRQPASFTGIVGIRPSYGIVSRYGTVPVADTLDQVGVFGKDVSDAVLMLSSIAGYDKKDSTSFRNPEGTIIFSNFSKKIDENYLKGMKIALPREIFDGNLDNDIFKKMEASINIFKSLGAKVEQVSLPHFEYSLAAYYIIATSEFSSNMARYDGIRYGHRTKDYETLDDIFINSRTESLGEEVKRRIMLGTYFLSSECQEERYKKALKVRTLIKNDFSKVFSKYDIILLPTVPAMPFEIEEKTKDPLSVYMSDIYTAPASLAGLCAMNVPAGFIDGLPVGIQLIGDRLKEANIIRAGLGFEGGRNNEI